MYNVLVQLKNDQNILSLMFINRVPLRLSFQPLRLFFCSPGLCLLIISTTTSFDACRHFRDGRYNRARRILMPEDPRRRLCSRGRIRAYCDRIRNSRRRIQRCPFRKNRLQKTPIYDINTFRPTAWTVQSRAKPFLATHDPPIPRPCRRLCSSVPCQNLSIL